MESGGLRIWIGALREAFEEAGILLATPEPGAATADADALDLARAHLNAGTVRLADVLAEHRLVLDAGDVQLFSHWLTPEGAPRRYDTWFLVAPAPERTGGQPRRCRARAFRMGTPVRRARSVRAGDLELIFPTLRTLRVLESFESAAALLDAVREANRATDGRRASSPTRPASASRSRPTTPTSRFPVGAA